MGNPQNPPRGYLGLLGLYGTGAYPKFSSEEIRPIVEMTPFYGNEAYSESGNIALAADNVYIEVPAGEHWMITMVSMSASAFSGAGVIAQCDCGFGIVSGGAAPFPLDTLQFTSTAAGDRASKGVMLPMPIVLPPLGFVYTFQGIAPGGNFTLGVQLMIKRLRNG